MKRSRVAGWPDLAYLLVMSLGPLCWLIMAVAGLAHLPRWTGWHTPQWIAGIDNSRWLLTVLIAPVLEEIVFRGGLQQYLLGRWHFARRVAGFSLANGCTSVVFSGLHLLQQSPLQAALVFFPSLMFGWTYDRYGRLLPSIMLHAFYNAGFLLFVA